MMARYKIMQKRTYNIPFEDLEALETRHGKNSASVVRALIKRYLHEKERESTIENNSLSKPQIEPIKPIEKPIPSQTPPKSALGYCNNKNCKHGHMPEKIQLFFDEKKQAWYCYNCQEFTPDVDEKTKRWVKWNKIKKS